MWAVLMDAWKAALMADSRVASMVVLSVAKWVALKVAREGWDDGCTDG